MDKSEKLRRGGLYPLAAIGIPRDVRAAWTGEKRPVRAGEWYLSGAIIEAYRAPNDLETPYHIAKLVHTRTVTEATGDYAEPASPGQVAGKATATESAPKATAALAATGHWEPVPGTDGEHWVEDAPKATA